jgi:hypothetical protein
MHRADGALGAGGGREAEKHRGGKGARRNRGFCLLSRKTHPGDPLSLALKSWQWFEH